MTLSEIREQVRYLLDEPDTTGFFSDTEINKWINEGQYKVAVKAKHLKDIASIVTTAGTKKYGLPDDYIDHFALVFDEDTKLSEISMEEALDGGYSKHYWIWEEDINLTFDPDGKKLTLYYYRAPWPMENDADEPELDEEYHDLLVTYALYRAKQKDRQYSEADIYKRDFYEGIADMKGRYSSRPSKNQITVQRQ